ncbi:hypothetical protein VTK73DRAFT_5978 [Phialemonium thermophilum]|uniref:Uncharacterized protein n=1 Tax=Phialemonium thermophilum TaxID=223376 RepID=A0ABR3WKW4_9PEZI
MSNGPLPSTLCLLYALPTRPQGDKVRFLGCVVSYSAASGILTLRHPDSPGGDNVSAHVDVELVLSRLAPEHTRRGQWVNVIGYVTLVPALSGSTKFSISSEEGQVVHVQALLLWSAGPLDIQQYTRTVEVLSYERPAETRGIHPDPTK